MAKISKNIKKLRASANMSQEALAEKLFISRQAVSSWENDRT
ncbi:MAG: helix-turn-helix transcriptional regulator [Clostridia bacterium]|nr:helix-turn-helix transcriptional regulator [Clostridia bacterium]